MRRVEIARLKAIVFKPKIDARYDAEDVVSHSEQRVRSIPVHDVHAMKSFLSDQPKNSYEIIAIDEAQFFDSALVQFVEETANQRKRVIVAGLDQDYFAKPFGPMPELLAMADRISKQNAVCMVCGDLATKTQRVSEEAAKADYEQPTAQVHVGADEAFEARCRTCFVPKVDLPYKYLIESK